MRRIYIVGCGRSGTMLMLRLFRTFASTHVHLKEVPAEFLETIETDADFVAGKRDAGAWKHFHSMNKDMFVVYMVRHPYDVLTSYHPKSKDAQQFYISPDRWMNEYGALRQLEARHPDEARIIYVRYEDLVSQPDGEQCRIADLTGQQIAVPFSKHQNISGGSVEKFRKREDFVRYIRGSLRTSGPGSTHFAAGSAMIRRSTTAPGPLPPGPPARL